MEEVKKRGRKKKVNEEITTEEKEPPVLKKRGRKKKWESTSFQNHFFAETSEAIKFETSEKILDQKDYSTNNLKFGNITIKIHDKETIEKPLIFEENKDSECLLKLSSEDEEDIHFTNVISKKKSVLLYNKEKNIAKLRCFHCHNFFDNPPFYLPFDYCQELDRYKIYGNFCSPNCVKTYCIDNKHFQSKLYLVGSFYRKLFGSQFRIKPAPSYLNLKEYGGNLTIEEFRESFYNNTRYTINTLNTKIIKDDFISV